MWGGGYNSPVSGGGGMFNNSPLSGDVCLKTVQ